ncbi:hypothetical protein OF83DRAFT_1172173 [Amylostereum chailletii]|nr:hypothetical protein OF83DRAFT_1172173 [Amylostereum chailletii]
MLTSTTATTCVTTRTIVRRFWVFEERHGGVAILSKQTNKYLVVDGDLHHGARVVAVHTHTPQVWEIRRVENDCIRIFAVGTSYNIDLCEHWHGGHHALGHPGGVPLIISNNCPCKNQVWRAYSCGNVATVGLHAKL